MSRSEVHINGKWLAQSLTGTQRYATEMVRALVADESFYYVMHVPAAADVPDWMRRSNVDVRRAPLAGIAFEQLYLPLATFGKLLLNFAGPAPLLKRRQLVTMHDATPFRYPKTFRKPFVAFYFAMYFLLGRSAEGLATVSNFSASELAAVLRIPASRFIVAGCAADALRHVGPMRPSIAPDGPFYLVVGTLAVHKNLKSPVTAAVRSGRDVVVVGASGQQQVFQDTSSLTSRALMAGRLTDSELVWLYRHAEALIFPSKYEGFGLPVLEAQSLGCPVLCSTAASLPEIAGDGARFFDPDDPSSLTGALDELESTAGVSDELRRRGYANSARYAWTTSAQKVRNWVSGRGVLAVRRRWDRVG